MLREMFVHDSNTNTMVSRAGCGDRRLQVKLSLSAFLQINVGDETGKWHHCCSAAASLSVNLIADGSRSQRKQHIHITFSGTDRLVVYMTSIMPLL